MNEQKQKTQPKGRFKIQKLEERIVPLERQLPAGAVPLGQPGPRCRGTAIRMRTAARSSPAEVAGYAAGGRPVA